VFVVFGGNHPIMEVMVPTLITLLFWKVTGFLELWMMMDDDG
jgi:hypothetical protein